MRAERGTVRRLLVTGSRAWTDEAVIRRELHARYPPGVILVSGTCPRGADAIAERIWRELGGTVERHPADWQRHGRAAGIIRNAEMIRQAADECLAFIRDQSAGASHTAGLARRAMIPVSIIAS